jgi:hypothetical protein
MAKKKSMTKPKGAAKPRASKHRSQAAPRQTQRKQGRTQPQEQEQEQEEVERRTEGDHPAGEPYEGERPRGEHFRGERNRGRRASEPGSLEQETLDRRAPYNKTYGQ